MGKMSTHDWSILHGRAEAGEDIEAKMVQGPELALLPSGNGMLLKVKLGR